ncbi:MAG: hypothetical protein IIB60_05345 [Planctomycetes bacterium]|nr:hypothetical protein [Planctomycetota bacterium]
MIQQGHPPLPVVLAAGTASICGQESLHAENLRAQVHETFDNLANLVRAATDTCAAADASPTSDVAVLLHQFRTLRVYYRHREHIDQLKTLVQASVPQVDKIEFFEAEICRPELLVEIEGTADVLA